MTVHLKNWLLKESLKEDNTKVNGIDISCRREIEYAASGFCYWLYIIHLFL